MAVAQSLSMIKEEKTRKMLAFFALTVLVTTMLLSLWILVFVIDRRSCSGLICTSSLTGEDGLIGPPGEDAPDTSVGPFGPGSIVTGKTGKQGPSIFGPTGATPPASFITGPTGATGRVGGLPHTHGGIFFPNLGDQTANNLITSSILLNYYEEFTVRCAVSFINDIADSPQTSLTFTRFGNQVNMGAIVGGLTPAMLINNPSYQQKDGALQPGVFQFSIATLNKISRFFPSTAKIWVLKAPVVVQFGSKYHYQVGPSSGDENSILYLPGQLLIQTSTASITMTLTATVEAGRFMTLNTPDVTLPPDTILWYGLTGLPCSFYVTWNLLL